MSDLKEQRIKFTKYLCRLIEFGSAGVYSIALGRDFDEDYENMRHMKGSLHYLGLANDLALYIDGVYAKDTESYRWLGDYWKALDPDCRWGGDFKNPDGNHFSMTFGGKA